MELKYRFWLSKSQKRYFKFHKFIQLYVDKKVLTGQIIFIKYVSCTKIVICFISAKKNG